MNLTVTDSGSPANTSKISKNVPVWPTPIANFTTNSPQLYCHNITFNDTTTGGTPPYTSWYWDFGDGGSSTEQNTSHRYSIPRTCDVTLIVTDAKGCTNSTTIQVVASDYQGRLRVGTLANVTSATVGTVIEYNITVENTGDVNLTSVLVADSLTGLNVTIPFLEHGTTQTVNTIYTVTESDVCGVYISNRATANGTGPCGFLTPTASGVWWRPCTYTAKLAITKEANVTSATVGTVIGYWINVSNTGNVNVTNVLVRDSITGLNETISALAPGATQTFNTTYTVTELDTSGWRINRATANGTDPCGFLTPTAIGVFGVRSG